MRGDKFLEELPIWKIVVCGDEGVGKTYFSITVGEFLTNVLNLKPEDISIKFLDLDGRLGRLVRQGVVPKEILERIDYKMVRDFEEVYTTSMTFIKELKEFVNSVPEEIKADPEKTKEFIDRRRKGAWILIDNWHQAWKWCMGEHAHLIYKKSMAELMQEKREEARKAGKATLPTFHQMFDYGVINSRHEEWVKAIVFSGYNFIFCSPLKLEEIKNKEGQIIKVRKRIGQWENNYLVDYFLEKEITDGKFYTRVYKTGKPFRVEGGSFTEVVTSILKFEELERSQRGFQSPKELKDEKIRSDIPPDEPATGEGGEVEF
jgi:hypothetical protein